jgi:hypothetical protein
MRTASLIVFTGLLVGAVLLMANASFGQSASRSSFDHFSTGFPLEGTHRNADCQSCHVGGIFQGTPRECYTCHARAGLVKATPVPTNHILTTPLCQDCHLETTWAPVRRVDHLQVLGSCQNCHNGMIATGKNPGHIVSSNLCEDCHTTYAWVPAVFDHAAVMPGTCSSCHNGMTATGKHPQHIQTMAECDDCHTSVAWLPASFDHAGVTGSCSTCHDGTTATGKNAGHFMTSLDCNGCHTRNAWLPSTFLHLSAGYPGDHRRQLECVDCHGANAEPVTWPFAAYQPDCAGCHAGDFKPGPHKKYENPDVTYNVNELRDCTGSCHVYTDATLTTIKDSRPAGSEHRVNANEF